MKTIEIRELSADQISDELIKYKREQLNLRFQRSSGQLDNTARVKEVIRIIAKLKTIQKVKINNKKVTWINKIEEINYGPVIFLGNEFFDALPIKQIYKKKKLFFVILVAHIMHHIIQLGVFAFSMI